MPIADRTNEVARTTFSVPAVGVVCIVNDSFGGQGAESKTRITIEDEKVVRSQLEYTFLVELLRQPDGGFVVHIPALPSASTQGRTYEEALANVKENVEAVLTAPEQVRVVPFMEREYMATLTDSTFTLSVPRNEPA